MIQTQVKDLIIINSEAYDVECYLNTKGEEVSSNDTDAMPVVKAKMCSDYKWQQMCLKSRLEHPEYYEDEDVQATIEKLQRWLTEHEACGCEVTCND